MPLPAMAWLALGGFALAAASAKRTSNKPTKNKPEEGEKVWIPHLKVAVPTRPSMGVKDVRLLRTFGEPTKDDYPAPYRFRDAKRLVDILIAATSETSPLNRGVRDEIVSRVAQINGSSLPNWRKTYALILTVIVPFYASNLLWHWYRPRSPVKDDRYNAIITWATIFFTLPVTATVSAAIEPNTRHSSLLNGMADYLNPATPLKNDLTPTEMRRALYDLYWHLAEWPMHNLGDRYGDMLKELHAHAVVRHADIHAGYPMSDPANFVTEGNFRMVDEILWFANARVSQSIAVDFDEGEAWANLVVQVVAVLVSAVAPLVSPALGAAIAAAGTAIQAVARALGRGDIDPAQIQTLGGAGATYMLNQAAIRLGLDDEMGQVESLLAAMR